MPQSSSEGEEVARRYAHRAATADNRRRYSPLNPDVWQGLQERQRALIYLLSKYANAPLDEMKVLEIGCGAGGNLLELIRLGFDPRNLVGNELLPARMASARRNLPAACDVLAGDASALSFADGAFDIVYQSTVFTSLLDVQFQKTLAERMWSWVKPGGAVLWYDFVYNNPSNPDVRGVSVGRIRELFPQANVVVRRVTLAPPIARRVCQVHPAAYSLFNAVPWLRTHVLCWIQKRA